MDRREEEVKVHDRVNAEVHHAEDESGGGLGVTERRQRRKGVLVQERTAWLVVKLTSKR